MSAAIAGEDKLVLIVEKHSGIGSLAKTLSKTLRVHHSGISVFTTDGIPLLSSGKRDYQALNQYIS